MISIRSVPAPSAITTVSGTPHSMASRAMAIPVFPDDGSKSRVPGPSRPPARAFSIMATATRSFREPVGKNHSSFA